MIDDRDLALDDRYFVGLDLGQAQDFTALVALRRRPLLPDYPDRQPRYHYTVRGLRRWPLGTLYPQIVADVVQRVAQPPLAGCVLGVDRTGCGTPVVDWLRQAKPDARLEPVLITSGHRSSWSETDWHVPKSELVATLQTILQSRRLEVPDTIPEAQALKREMQTFRAKITAKGNEVFEAADWRSQAHDDIVLALAIAAWLGEHAAEPNTGPLIYNTSAMHGWSVARDRLETARAAFDGKQWAEAAQLAASVWCDAGASRPEQDAARALLSDLGQEPESASRGIPEHITRVVSRGLPADPLQQYIGGHLHIAGIPMPDFDE